MCICYSDYPTWLLQATNHCLPSSWWQRCLTHEPGQSPAPSSPVPSPLIHAPQRLHSALSSPSQQGSWLEPQGGSSNYAHSHKGTKYPLQTSLLQKSISSSFRIHTLYPYPISVILNDRTKVSQGSVRTTGDHETGTVLTAIGRIPSFGAPPPLLPARQGLGTTQASWRRLCQVSPFRTPSLVHPPMNTELHPSDLVYNVVSLVQVWISLFRINILSSDFQ